MMSSGEKPQYHSVEEYLAFEDQAQTKSEYIDGWIRAMTGAALRHNMISVNTLIACGNQLKRKTCRPYNSDTKVRIDRAGMKRFYYPDVQVVCKSNDQLSVFQDQPVLIIEVLSPSTRRYDLDEKMAAYLTIPSLECYIALEQHQPIALGFVSLDVAASEIDHHEDDQAAQSQPEWRPRRDAFVFAHGQPASRQQVACQIADPTGHHAQKRLGTRAPLDLDPFGKVELRTDVDKRVGKSV